MQIDKAQIMQEMERLDKMLKTLQSLSLRYRTELEKKVETESAYLRQFAVTLYKLEKTEKPTGIKNKVSGDPEVSVLYEEHRLAKALSQATYESVKNTRNAIDAVRTKISALKAEVELHR